MGLQQVMATLDLTPGLSAPTLADETIVVVLSEMGRTPYLNSDQGKDHWPYTSAMILGKGFEADRVIGEYDDVFYGRPVDPKTGVAADDAPQEFSAQVLGATLLALGDVDPGPYLGSVQPLYVAG